MAVGLFRLPEYEGYKTTSKNISSSEVFQLGLLNRHSFHLAPTCEKQGESSQQNNPHETDFFPEAPPKCQVAAPCNPDQDSATPLRNDDYRKYRQKDA